MSNTSMKKFSHIPVSAFLFSAACGGAGDHQISGRLDMASFGRTGATLVAVSDDGQIQKAEVGKDGHFEIALDTAHAHAIAFRSTERGRETTFANLVMKTPGGRRTIFRCTSSGFTDLGEVRREAGTEVSCRGAGGAESFQSAMVSGSSMADEDLADLDATASEALNDRDGDGRPDSIDDDADDDGVCNDEVEGEHSVQEKRRGADDTAADDRGAHGRGKDDPASHASDDRLLKRRGQPEAGDDRGANGKGKDNAASDDRLLKRRGQPEVGDDRGANGKGKDDPAGDDKGGKR